jgi:excisionase family DNA binding protein
MPELSPNEPLVRLHADRPGAAGRAVPAASRHSLAENPSGTKPRNDGPPRVGKARDFIAEIRASTEAIEALTNRSADRGRGTRLTASPWLNATEAAAYLRCPVSRVRKLTMTGELPVHRDGRRVLFHRAELDTFIRDGGATCP